MAISAVSNAPSSGQPATAVDMAVAAMKKGRDVEKQAAAALIDLVELTRQAAPASSGRLIDTYA